MKNFLRSYTAGRLIVFSISFLTSSTIMLFVIKSVDKSIVEGNWIFLVLLIVMKLAILTSLLYWGHKTESGEKIDAYLLNRKIKKAEKSKILIVEKMSVVQENIRQKKQEVRNSYFLRGAMILPTKPLIFRVQTVETIDPKLPPYVTVNNKPVGNQLAGDYFVDCFVGDAITAEDTILNFSIGENQARYANPYYFYPEGITRNIRWQVEGHNGERKILIPIEYFPKATENTFFEFSLIINDISFGIFTGKIEGDDIVVKLEKKISKKDCLGKKANLVLTYGRKNKIALPDPIIMTRNGQLIGV